MTKLLIFDLDGTLVDSARDIVTTTNTLLVRRGFEPLPEAKIVASIGEGARKLIYDLFPDAHTNRDVLLEIDREFFEIYDENLLKTTRPFPGCVEFLRTWSGQIAVVTNKYEHLARRTIEGTQLREFDWCAIFGSDSLNEKKPHPLPLLTAMKAVGCEPHETLMIGDGIPDMLAAKRAGVRAIACEFGYADIKLLIEAGATTTLPAYERLPEIIQNVAAGNW